MAHLHVSHAMDSLVHGDGTPDHQARMANLTNLVANHLNINELRVFKNLLSTVTFPKDIIANVPVEILTMIAGYLDAQDIFPCLGVSKAWREKFKNPQVIFIFAKHLFPLIAWQSQRDGLEDQESQAKLCSSILQVHLPARLKWIGRRTPRETNFRRYCWDDETYFTIEGKDYSHFAPIADVQRNARCAHGRIAWQSESHTLVVDSLHTRIRKILDVPRGKLMGPSITLVALGDKLVIATMDRHLFAWDFSTARFERATLPSIAGPCSTVGNQTAVSVGKDLYIWQFGGPLLAIDLSGFETRFYPTAIIHPHLADVVYVNMGHTLTKEGLKFVVYKFTERKLAGTFEVNISANLQSGVYDKNRLAVSSPQLESTKADSYGNYFLFGFRFIRWYASPGDTKQHTRRSKDDRAIEQRGFDLGEHYILQFNIYNETFSNLNIWPSGTSDFPSCMWNDHIFQARELDAAYEEGDSTSIHVQRDSFKLDHSSTYYYKCKVYGELRYSEEMAAAVDDDFVAVLLDHGYVTWSLNE